MGSWSYLIGGRAEATILIMVSLCNLKLMRGTKEKLRAP